MHKDIFDNKDSFRPLEYFANVMNKTNSLNRDKFWSFTTPIR